MGNALLAAVVDVRRWLRQDSDTPYPERLARDRALGRELTARDDLQKVLGWWERLGAAREDVPGGEPAGSRVAALARMVVWLLLGGGFLAGALLGAVAFDYDGRHPVNLLMLLGLLVGVPLLLLALTLLLLVAGRVPGLATLRAGMGALNPARWAGAWLDRVAGLELYGGFAGTGSAFARWQLVAFSQWFALGYFAGVLLTGAVLVTVTDLAFGWSSTLELDARTVHELFALLAVPWQGWLPWAVPDLALVEASRFYRLETDPVAKVEAMRLGGWWPFVLLTILFWGLLPRLVLLLVAQRRLARALRAMLCEDPEVVALLDRLQVPRVAFAGDGPAMREPESAASTGAPAPAGDGPTVTVVWNHALPEADARAWWARWFGGGDGPVLGAGARSGGEELLAALAPRKPGPFRILVITKGWEPPLLEFVDFLQRLRAAAGPEATVVVAPVNTRGTGVDHRDRRVWAEFLGRQAGGRLYVQQATEGTAEPAAEEGAP